jgi:hypothetical protein
VAGGYSKPILDYDVDVAPADITVLPTERELTNAKLGIEAVEVQLNEALSALAQAKLRVDELKKELFQRKA